MSEDIISAEFTEMPSSGEGESAKTREHPIETAHLKKGDAIPIEELERVFGMSRNDKKFDMLALGAKEYIERRLARRDLHVVVRVLSTGIFILTDEQALVYLPERFETETRRREKMLKQLNQLDRGQLCQESQDSLDRQLAGLGRRVHADRSIRREQLKLAPVPRSTPGLQARLKNPSEH